MSTPSPSAATLRDETVAGTRGPPAAVEAAIERSRAVGAGRAGLNIFAWTDDDDARSHAAAA
ncbi:MAG TPA: hypothetical protein VIJ90_03045, partial [Gemmatimonadaceae bacterium]